MAPGKVLPLALTLSSVVLVLLLLRQHAEMEFWRLCTHYYSLSGDVVYIGAPEKGHSSCFECKMATALAKRISGGQAGKSFCPRTLRVAVAQFWARIASDLPEDTVASFVHVGNHLLVVFTS